MANPPSRPPNRIQGIDQIRTITRTTCDIYHNIRRGLDDLVRPVYVRAVAESPSRAPLHWRAFVGLIARLPQAPLSRAAGRLADIRWPRWLRRPLLATFAAVVGAETNEAELPLADYPSLDAFFVRRLKAGLRSFPEDPNTVVSPVDGRLAEIGTITDGRLLQVKGLSYTAADLLDDATEADRFDGGTFITIYLSPKDYHRIHVPCTGTLGWARHVPGALLPVNPPAVAVAPDLFARNERLVCRLDSPYGRVAVAAVAAINVGRISAAFDPGWNGPRGGVTNRRGAQATTRSYDPPVELSRGDDLMAFHLGSTIVMLLDGSGFRLRQDLVPGMVVRLGQPLTDPIG